MKKARYIIVFVTVPDKKTADEIIKTILEAKLAACVNSVKGVESFYWWKGRIECAGERLLIIKTVKSKFAALAKKIKKTHPYEVPEIISAEIAQGNKDYLDWIEKYAG